MAIWNPWHGCEKISPGCMNCYVYRRDSQFGKNSREISKTNSFNLPIAKKINGEYKLQTEPEPVYTCMTSDFFIKEADQWRGQAWEMIHTRSDLNFVIITKRIDRMSKCIPENWGNGYSNVTIICTCENQDAADYRLPIFLNLPVFRREVIIEPMLEEINMEKYLGTGKISTVTCGGESGDNARLCCYDWVLSCRKQCVHNNVSFYFKQTGANFKKNNKIYHIIRRQQILQSKKANIDYHAYDEILKKLSKSDFRSKFRLYEKEKEYVTKNGMDIIRKHAEEFIKRRLAPSAIANDGKQTPMRGHPVFLAQHATATCCRGCLSKWHGIRTEHHLTEKETQFIVSLICEWIYRQMGN